MLPRRLQATDRHGWMNHQKGIHSPSARCSERKPFHHPRVQAGIGWPKLTEQILDPALPIIDPHHHLWKARPDRYLLDDLVADLRTGHNVLATVFIQCGSEYRAEGPPGSDASGRRDRIRRRRCSCLRNRQLRPPASLRRHRRARRLHCLAIGIDPVLEAHVKAGGGRFKGIRHSGTYDAWHRTNRTAGSARQGCIADPAFRAGFARLHRTSA